MPVNNVNASIGVMWNYQISNLFLVNYEKACYECTLLEPWLSTIGIRILSIHKKVACKKRRVIEDARRKKG